MASIDPSREELAALKARALMGGGPVGGAVYSPARLVEEYIERLEHPYIAAAKGYVDDRSTRGNTRVKIAHALEMLRTKSVSVPPKKHGNIPL